MINIFKPIIFFIFLITFSCEKQKVSGNNLILSNVGYKEIILDSLTSNTNINFRLNTIKNKEYISFFNRKNYSIDIYDYKSGKLFKNIQLVREGANAIMTPFYSLEYHIHTLDSIFISTIKNYYLLNSGGKILKKITPIIGNKYYKIKKPIFDETTNYNKNILSFEIDTDLPDKKEESFLRRDYNFSKEIIKENFINENILVRNYNEVLDFKLLNLKKRGTNDKIIKYFVKRNDKLFASTSINDSIYVFDSDKKLINIFYAGSRNVNVPNFIKFFNRKNIIKIGQATAIEDKLEQPPFYTNMFIDRRNGFIYRILIHGSEAVLNFNRIPTKEMSMLKGATLIAVNIDSKELYSFKLPIDEIQIPLDNSKIFLTDAGIHFPLIRQEKENIIRYKILKLKENEN